MLVITFSGSLPLKGAITDSLYSYAASSGFKLTTLRFETSFILVSLLLSGILNTSCRLEAGSVLTNRTFLPLSARLTAVAQAIEVLPTPPLPVKNTYFVLILSIGLNLFMSTYFYSVQSLRSEEHTS